MKGLYYRRKIALALVEGFGGTLSGTKFQKLLFLLTQNQMEKAYDFVPYKFGCFSFQSYDDKGALIAKGLLAKDEKNWVLPRASTSYLSLLTENDRQLVIGLKKKFHAETQKNLVRYVYTNYPYFATKSEIAHEILTPNELKFVEQSIPKSSKQMFYTIGYEGKSIEQYINELIATDVRLLCDVRKNPLSRKFGFSKSQLSDYLMKFGIEYLHMPELGIDSEKRKHLGDTVTHEELFHEYKKTTLQKKHDQLLQLVDLLKQHKRIAITCFEADPSCCHRSCVATEMRKIIPPGYAIADL